MLPELLTQEPLHPTKMLAAIVHTLCLCDIRKTLSLRGLFLAEINTMRYIPTTEKHTKHIKINTKSGMHKHTDIHKYTDFIVMSANLIARGLWDW